MKSPPPPPPGVAVPRLTEGGGGQGGVVCAEQAHEGGHHLIQEGRGDSLALLVEGRGPLAPQVEVLLQEAVTRSGAQGLYIQGGCGLRGIGWRRQARQERGLGEALIPAVSVQGESLRINHVLHELHLGEDSQLLVHRLGRVHRRLPPLHSPLPCSLALGSQGGHNRRVARHGGRRDIGAGHFWSPDGGLGRSV